MAITFNVIFLYIADSIASVRPMAAEGTSFNGVINCNRADEAAKHVAYK